YVVPLQSDAVRSVLLSGNAPAIPPMVPKGSAEPRGILTPLPRTVMAAPSYAPIRPGSINISARLPLTLVSQPTTPSIGARSTIIPGKSGPPVAVPAPLPVAKDEAQLLVPAFGLPSGVRPKRQTTFCRHGSSSFAAGCVLASMMLVAAPTPCSRI